MYNSKALDEQDNDEFLLDLIRNAAVRLEDLSGWLNLWAMVGLSSGSIPGVECPIPYYPNYPLEVRRIYYWPLEFKMGVTAPTDERLVSFLEQGAARGILLYRRYPAGYDWFVLSLGYEDLCAEFGYSDSSFGVKNIDRCLELERTREDMVRGIRKQRT